MSDPQDRRMADLFEIELRRKAELDPSNAWELVWFLGLPLEIRCSYMHILEARIDQEPTRRFLFRQACYRQRNWRDPVPDVMFMQTLDQPSRPWASLGQRQRRKPVTYGRSRPPRSHKPSSAVPGHNPVPVSSAPPVAPKRRAAASRRPLQPKLDAYTPRHDPPCPYAVPSRPSTPLGLRQAITESPPLVRHAMGYTSDGSIRRVCSPLTPPEPVRYKPYPQAFSTESVRVRSKVFPGVFPCFAAAGRHQVAPWERRPARLVADELCSAEEDCPGITVRLMKALFPTKDGVNDGDMATKISINRDIILDFVRGLLTVPDANMSDSMPEPEPCECGGPNKV
ncbi:hypothetical protein FRC09_013967 [Ceratobasidium sp. 395]|nr:hypothetical protein FRC09_013967 [Ceratobasidium sp. 395]